MSEIYFSEHDKKQMFPLKNGQGVWTIFKWKMDLDDFLNELLLSRLKLMRIEKITQKIETLDGETKIITTGYQIYYED